MSVCMCLCVYVCVCVAAHTYMCLCVCVCVCVCVWPHSPKHFTDMFAATDADAGLAAGIFHRKQVQIIEVKQACADAGVPVRISAQNC